jgi:S-DNA-T family DNA segregation ATPase FtsK/SpoIIIE
MSRESSKGGKGQGSPRRREVVGILLLAVALFLLLSVASLELGSGSLMGPCGATVGLGAWALLGVGAYFAAAALGAVAIGLLRGQPVRLRSVETLGYVGAATAVAVLVHLGLGRHRLHGYSPGGLVGEYGAELTAALVGKVGTVLVGLVVLALSTIACTPITMRGIVELCARGGRAGLAVLVRAARYTGSAAVNLLMAIFPARDEEEDEEPAEADERDPERVPAAIHEHATEAIVRRGKGEDDTRRDVAPPDGDTRVIETERPKRRRKKEELEAAASQVAAAGMAAVAGAEVLGESVAEAAPAAELAEGERTEAMVDPPVAPEKEERAAVAAPAIIAPVERKAPPAPPQPSKEPEPGYDAASYRLPELDLLNFDDPSRGELDRQAMLDLAGRLEKTLADYGVKGRVSEIHPGPVVTMYEFVPQAGTKLSKITALSNDLAMTLEALKVRIVAPIPGKAAVGIEVPNKARETVYLKEIIGDEAFARAKSKLTLALGKDIAGRPQCVDLARMPHLLIAGTTGSGKSVSVNGMICSILFNATPDDVKLIMIDPKMLELSIYEGIPHLLLPVVTDPKKANLALRWAVDEMERRYDLISKAGVRDIGSYNKKVVKQLEGASDEKPRKAEKKIKVMLGDQEVEVEASEEAVAAAGGQVNEEVRDQISAARAAMQHADAALQQEEAPKKLPYIVVIIDEFADLMMVASKEVETSVARIAQKARAAGIHLLLATQRPSVDVITGLIKANFPSRIAFQVASKIDARTILDQQGAESLLGAGDMLFTDRGMALRRIHGPLVTDVEIHRLVEFLKSQGKPVYDLDILKPRGDEEGGDDGGEDFADEMYDQAVALVAETRQASISMIQRRLRVGYNRAARMVERMEREGIVSAADGAKGREVLVSSHSAA